MPLDSHGGSARAEGRGHVRRVHDSGGGLSLRPAGSRHAPSDKTRELVPPVRLLGLKASVCVCLPLDWRSRLCFPRGRGASGRSGRTGSRPAPPATPAPALGGPPPPPPQPPGPVTTGRPAHGAVRAPEQLPGDEILAPEGERPQERHRILFSYPPNHLVADSPGKSGDPRGLTHRAQANSPGAPSPPRQGFRGN